MNVLKRKVRLYKKLHRWADAGFQAEVTHLSSAQKKRDEAASELARMNSLHSSSEALYSNLRQANLGMDETRQLSNKYLAYLATLANEKQRLLQEREQALSLHVEQLKHERARRQAMNTKLGSSKRELYEDLDKHESLDLMTIAAARELANDRE